MSDDILGAIAHGNTIAADRAKSAAGAYLVRLLGRELSDSDGYGDPTELGAYLPADDLNGGIRALPRLAGVSPLASGIALVAQIPGLGDDEATSSSVILGAIAQGKYDALDTFWKRKTFTGSALPVGETVDSLVQTNVPIPTNRTVALLGIAFAMVAAATVSTQVDMSLRLGGTETSTMEPSFANRSGAVGPPVSSGLDTNIQTLIVPHVRVLTVVSSEPETSVNANIRFSSQGGAGNSRVRSAWLFGVRVVF